jgi:hypothetical protein
MRNIKQIREEYDSITHKGDKEESKLTTLVRAGLFDAKKLPALKRALEKGVDSMTPQDKRMLISLLDALMSEVLDSPQIYQKIRQSVTKEKVSGLKEETTPDFLSKADPRADKAMPKDKNIPSVIILKRKAIRVFPDNQKVVLYYSQALDKYVTIPFTGIQTSTHSLHEAKKDMNDDDYYYTQKNKSRMNKPRTGGLFSAPEASNERKKQVYARLLAKSMEKGDDASARRSPLSKALGKVGAGVSKSMGSDTQKQIKRGVSDVAGSFAQRVSQYRQKAGMGPVSSALAAAVEKLPGSYANRQKAKLGLTGPTVPRKPVMKPKAGPTTPAPSPSVTPEFHGVGISENQIDEGVLDTVDAGVRNLANYMGGDYIAAGGNYAVNKVLGQKTSYAQELAKQRAYDAQAKQQHPFMSSPAGAALTAAGAAALAAAAPEVLGAGTAAAPEEAAAAGGEKALSVATDAENAAVTGTEKAASDAGKAAAESDILNVRSPANPEAEVAAGQKLSNLARAKNFLKNYAKYKALDTALGGGGSGGGQSGSSTGSSVPGTERQDYQFTAAGRAQPQYVGPTDARTDAARAERERQVNLKASQAMFPVQENVYKTIKNIVYNNLNESTVQFGEQQIKINNTVARKLVTVHESMNKTNKKKMETMLNESASSFNKILNFAVRY